MAAKRLRRRKNRAGVGLAAIGEGELADLDDRGAEVDEHPMFYAAGSKIAQKLGDMFVRSRWARPFS